MAILAYRIGRPVERQIQVSGSFSELKDEIERAKQSPAFMDFCKRWAAGEIQKSGGEKAVENARVIEPGNE